MPIVNDWIDVHAHFTPPMTAAESDARWAAMREACWTGPKPPDWSADAQLAYMDRVGIAMQMLSNIPKTLDALRASNDYGASTVARHPSRFGLLAALPTDDSDAALAEIFRGYGELSADGFAVTCHYNGIYLGDPSLEPVWAELDRRGAAVFAHPDAYKPGSLGRPAAILEVAFETTRTIVDMLYAGIFRRYPNFRLVLAHCGAALPALSGRLMRLGTQPWVPNPNGLTDEELRAHLAALYLDTAMTGTVHTLAPALAMTSADHIVYGSDCGVPCTVPETAIANIEALLAFTGLAPDEIEAIGHNALRLFPAAAERIARSRNSATSRTLHGIEQRDSPPPCGEGSGVGVLAASSIQTKGPTPFKRREPPSLALPHKGGGKPSASLRQMTTLAEAGSNRGVHAVGSSVQPGVDLRDTQPLIEIAIEAKVPGDGISLRRALAALAAEDPDLRVKRDNDSGQTILGGRDEAHLDGCVDALLARHGVAVNIGAPQVAYCETLTRRIEKDYTHKTQTGGMGQFARVKIVFEPTKTGAGSAFESKIAGGAVPEEYIPGVEKGIASVMGSGILAGFPVVDVQATLIDGAFHDVDSSALAFEIAARAAFREALREGGAVLLEPIMTVEVTTPEDYTGFVIGDLRARRGEVQGRSKSSDAVVIAMVPLANLFGYASQLKSGTQGRGSFTARFAEYRPVTPSDDDDPPPAMAAALRR